MDFEVKMDLQKKNQKRLEMNIKLTPLLNFIGDLFVILYESTPVTRYPFLSDLVSYFDKSHESIFYLLIVQG